jgi:hypothetical protein
MRPIAAIFTRASIRKSAVTSVALAFAVLLARSNAGRGADLPPQRSPASPVDNLLRLVPPDSALILSIEGLREQASAFLKSRLAADLMQLPVVQTWFASEKYRQFERSRARIETVLGANLTTLRDELLGDAVVLALRLPPEAPADNNQARGIFLVQARDLALLKRVIRVITTTQQESGELVGVAERQRNRTVYYLREFPEAANRPSEWYVVYPDGTFAFSNSEALIQSVIDRKDGLGAGVDGEPLAPKVDPGLGDLPKLKAIERRLPQPALARLFVDPRHFERMLAASPRPSKPVDARLMALIERYLASVDYAGATLSWSEGAIVVNTVETLNPSLLDAWLRRWAGDARRPDLELTRVPPTALAIAFGHVDAVALLDALSQIVPDEDQLKLANFETMLTGLLLGQNVRDKVLPRLGPGVVAYFDTPSDTDEPHEVPGPNPSADGRWPFPTVLATSVDNESKVGPPVSLAAALDNALRTMLAMTALDDKRAQGRSRITTRAVAGSNVMTLDPPISFAYAVDRSAGRLVLGTTMGAVGRYLESSSDPSAGGRLRQLRSEAFADAETFLYLDFDALNRLASKHRDRLVQTLAARQKRPIDEVDRDLAQVQSMARLFRAGYLTSRFDADATAVRRSVGLIRHEKPGK